MKLDRTDTPTKAEYGTVYVAFELSKAKWKLGLVVPGSEKMSRFPITGGGLGALAARGAVSREDGPVPDRGGGCGAAGGAAGGGASQGGAPLPVSADRVVLRG